MGRKVIDLESRQRLKNRPQMLFFDRVAPTGARPALGSASDGQDYWVKFAQNDQGSETVVNEVVASIVGDSIGAPVAPWAIVEVPLGLKQILDGRLIVPGPAFGSRGFISLRRTVCPKEYPMCYRMGILIVFL